MSHILFAHSCILCTFWKFDLDVVYRALVGVGAMGAMAPPLFENMLIGTHTFMGELNEL